MEQGVGLWPSCIDVWRKTWDESIFEKEKGGGRSTTPCPSPVEGGQGGVDRKRGGERHAKKEKKQMKSGGVSETEGHMTGGSGGNHNPNVQAKEEEI